MDKIWIFTELFYPEETSTAFIMSKIAERLSTKYTTVNVVCSDNSYSQSSKCTANKLPKNILIHRIKTLFINKKSSIIRTFRFIELSLKFLFFLLFKVKKNDKVFLVTNPATLLIVVALVKKIKKIETILLVHDVFPENTIAANIIRSEKSIIYKFIKYIFDWSYKQMTKIIVLGRDMQKILQSKLKDSNSTVVIIENWGENEIIYPTKMKNYDKIIFQYAGNLGRVQGLDLLVDVISQIKNENLLFEFIGNGAQKEKLQEIVSNKKINNIIFKGSYTRLQQNDILNDCHIAIVSLSKGMYGLGVPSKFYNIICAGKPVMYIGEENTEINLVLKENDIGFSFTPNDTSKMIDFFNNFEINSALKVKGENARMLFLEKYTQDIILNKFLQEI